MKKSSEKFTRTSWFGKGLSYGSLQKFAWAFSSSFPFVGFWGTQKKDSSPFMVTDASNGCVWHSVCGHRCQNPAVPKRNHKKFGGSNCYSKSKCHLRVVPCGRRKGVPLPTRDACFVLPTFPWSRNSRISALCAYNFATAHLKAFVLLCSLPSTSRPMK